MTPLTSPISYTFSIVVRTYLVGFWFVVLVHIAGSIGECCEGTLRLFRVLHSITVKYN